jgi:geranylgeranylglycerol-phosphate geranylgeranyltransferase
MTSPAHMARSWRQSIGVMRLLRLSNSLPASLLVLLGADLASGWPFSWRVWQAALVMWLITAYGYVSNDCTDLAEDRVNKPDRPLPAGLVTPAFARALAWTLALCGGLLALPLGWRESLAAMSVLALLTLYNHYLKGTPGGGNSLIALLAGSTLWTGSIAVWGFQRQAIQAVALPASLLITFVAARELIKTLEDLAGDRYAGHCTLAIRWGGQTVLYWVAGLTGLLIVLSVGAVLWLGYSSHFGWVITLGVQAPLLFSLAYLWSDQRPRRVSRCLALLKGSYFAGIVALILAKHG